MKSVIALIALFSLAQANAEITPACLGQAIKAVNKQHMLAEGASYAVRVLHEGEFATALLVGHSDETDPTDYLVTVVTNGVCKVKSIVVASEAGGVTEYTPSEEKALSDAEAAYQDSLIPKALELIEKVPQSGYDVRTLCISGDKVTAIVPMTHWSAKDRKTIAGTLKEFPIKTVDKKDVIKLVGKKRTLVSGTDQDGFYKVAGEVSGKMADICVMETKMVLE